MSNQTAEESIRWWEEKKKEDRAQAIKMTMDRMDEENAPIQESHLRHMRLYRNLAMVGFGPYGYTRPDVTLGSPLSLNVVRNMVNAVHSKITKNRPRMTFQTSGANYEQKEKARLLQRFIDGLFYKMRLYEQTPKTFLDCAVFGNGYLKVIPGDKKRMPIMAERVFSPEIRVDHSEGMHGKPRNIYQVKYMDRRVAQRKYPKAAKAISEMRAVSWGDDVAVWGFIPDNRSQDIIRVVESYHTAAEKGADDGIMSVTSDGIELDSGPWDYEFHPFVTMRWSDSVLGFYGMGLPEELMGIQVEINRIVRKIQMSFALLSNPYVFVDRASNIARGQMTDIPGSIIMYTNKKPEISAPTVVSGEVFSHLWNLYEKAYEIAGVSMSQAAGQTKYYESARAQLVDNQTADIRFANVSRAWERLHEEAAYLALRYVENERRSIKVKAFGEDGFEEISFSEDIDLDEDEWVMKIRPTSALGEDPAGQIDEATRLIKSGLVQHPEEILEQLESPDIAAYVKRITAPKRLVERMVGSMLKGGPQQMPEPQMNLALSADLAQQLYIEAKLDGVSEDNLKKVRRFMQACVRMMNSAQQQAQQAPPLPSGGGVPSAQPPVASSAPMPDQLPS